LITIKFNNWDKYNIRSGGIKRPFWFSFSNQFFTDSTMFDFSSEEKLTFIYLLCEASQTNKNGEVVVSEEKYKRFTDIKIQVLNAVVDKLLQLEIISSSRTGRVRDAYGTLQDKTEQDKTRQNNIQTFDFDFLYSKYPLKKGKTDGIGKLKKLIKCEEDFELVSRAIDKYIHHIKTNGTEAKYIKHFSTFVSSWRDWLDDDAGSVISVIPRQTFNKANQRTENNRAAAEAYMKKLEEKL